MRRWRLMAVVAAVVIGVAACGGDDGGDGGELADVDADGDATSTTAPAATPSGGDEITIADFAFAPAELEVAVGTEVTATNDDSAAHTWTSSDDEWDSGDLEQGASFSHTFEEAGTFAYVCKIHPSMRGTVTVS